VGFTIGGAIFESAFPAGRRWPDRSPPCSRRPGDDARRRQSRVDDVRDGPARRSRRRQAAARAKLPNENELADRFASAGRPSARPVLGLLEAANLARRHGSGTYVATAPRSRHALETTVSYTAMIREAGMSRGRR